MVSWLTTSCLESPYISSSSCLKKQERGPSKSLLDDDDDEPSTKPPKAVFLGRKAVSFEPECVVTEYDVDLTPGQRSCMWWEAVELDRFRFKRRKRHPPSDSSLASSSSSASSERQQHHGSHPRQVVFLYEAYKGMEKGSELLGEFSRRLSKHAREKAYRRAVMLSKSTGTYGPTTSYPKNRNHFFLLTTRITDFYIESLLETVEKNWWCGVWGTESVRE